MSNLDNELTKARERVERLEEKKRVKEEKARARFIDAIMSTIEEIKNDPIENVDKVSVRTLINRAQAKIDKQDEKRKRAADKAAASRRESRSKASNEASSEASNEPSSQPVGVMNNGGF